MPACDLILLSYFHCPNNARILLLAQLNIIVNMPPLNGGAHHRGLCNARLQLPLGRQVDDDGQVDDGHRAQHCQGLQSNGYGSI